MSSHGWNSAKSFNKICQRRFFIWFSNTIHNDLVSYWHHAFLQATSPFAPLSSLPSFVFLVTQSQKGQGLINTQARVNLLQCANCFLRSPLGNTSIENGNCKLVGSVQFRGVIRGKYAVYSLPTLTSFMHWSQKKTGSSNLLFSNPTFWSQIGAILVGPKQWTSANTWKSILDKVQVYQKHTIQKLKTC